MCSNIFTDPPQPTLPHPMLSSLPFLLKQLFFNSFFPHRVPLGFPAVMEMGFPHVYVQPTQRHIIREIVLSLTQLPSNASASLVSGMVGFHVYLLLLCWNFASFQLAQVLDMLSQSLCIDMCIFPVVYEKQCFLDVIDHF